MAKSRLKAELEQLEADIIETLLAGHHQWRADLAYPESHSDMQGAVRGLLRMYEIKRRPVAVDLEYHDEAPEMLARHFRSEWQREVAEGKTNVSFETWVAHGNHWRDRAAVSQGKEA